MFPHPQDYLSNLPPEGQRSLRRVRLLVALFIIGLFVSGATAIPLKWEMELLTRWMPLPADASTTAFAGIIRWIHQVKDALVDTDAKYPFLAYGTDWLAFGHFIIALVFVGAYRDPVRNIWLFDFGMLACALVIPYALIFGEMRGIPFGWRLIDCAFGLLGFPLVWLAKRETQIITQAVGHTVTHQYQES